MKKAMIALRTSGLLTAMLGVVFIACNKNDDQPLPKSDVMEQQDPEPENRPPMAHAGDNRQEEIGSLVKLDGSLSSDPDGDALTYNWSFLSLPEGSTATLIGVGNDIAEYLMDKAGDYTIQLEVSDGTLKTTNSVTISNKAPLLEIIRSTIDVDYRSDDDELEDEIAQRGQRFQIYGQDFSPAEAENKLTLAGHDLEVEQVRLGEVSTDLDRLTITIPENALSGELVLTVGSRSTAWPAPIRLVENPPVQAWIESEPALIEKDRPSGTYRDIGTVFKPLVNGQLVSLGVRSNRFNNTNEKPRITVWDMAAETPLISMDLESTRTQMEYISLEVPIQMQAGKEYGVTFASNDWFFYTTGTKVPIFPMTSGQIEIVKHIQTAVFNDPFTDLVFPNEASLSYLTRGVDILFVPDME